MDKSNQQISGMFNRIARRYDLLNHLLSMGIDRRWRRALVKELMDDGARHVLDMATGTADLALLAARAGISRIEGVDIASAMLDLGREKIVRAGLQERITLIQGRAEEIPFDTNTFDAAMVAFGVRNFEDLQKGLQEMLRVLRPGGAILVLEFSLPGNPILRAVYLFYFKKILPFLGGIISGDREAYAYLPASVQSFPHGKDFLQVLEEAGFDQVRNRRFSGGIASLYKGVKPG